MYFATTLVDKTKLCIPAAWLQHINMVQCFNNVFKRYEKRVIFFSIDEEKSPNFLLPICNVFDEKIDACYEAFVMRAFETKQLCIDYLLKRRGILPPVYFPVAKSNENTIQNQIQREMAIDTKILIKREVESLRKVLLNTNKVQSIDLTDSDAEDLQNGIDDMIEIEDELTVLQEDDKPVNDNYDVLSGNIPFIENSVIIVFFSLLSNHFISISYFDSMFCCCFFRRPVKGNIHHINYRFDH